MSRQYRDSLENEPEEDPRLSEQTQEDEQDERYIPTAVELADYQADMTDPEVFGDQLGFGYEFDDSLPG